MLRDMELWTDVRRALFVESISKREACRRFGLSFYLIDKIFRSDHPGRYRRASSPHPKLGPFIPFIEGYLAEDKHLPVKHAKNTPPCERVEILRRPIRRLCTTVSRTAYPSALFGDRISYVRPLVHHGSKDGAHGESVPFQDRTA